MKFNSIEKEILILNAIFDMIGSIVNFEVLNLSSNHQSAEIRFKSNTHQAFFNIVLVDFFSKPDEKFFDMNFDYLSLLQEIAKNPSFNSEFSNLGLKNSVDAFINWLNTEICVEKIWFPSIEKECDLTLKRIQFIKICGNLSKHNFTRLTIQALEIEKIFKKNNIQINQQACLLLLKDFYENFYTNIFNYHGSTIAEFLNNIRWGIYEYLNPEFNRSFKRKSDGISYEYRYPDNIQEPYVKSYYWDLMNNVREKPYFPKFQVPDYVKLRY